MAQKKDTHRHPTQYAGGISIQRYLTVREIRQALGDSFTLELG